MTQLASLEGRDFSRGDMAGPPLPPTGFLSFSTVLACLPASQQHSPPVKFHLQTGPKLTHVNASVIDDSKDVTILMRID